jgi:hypothetical protein
MPVKGRSDVVVALVGSAVEPGVAVALVFVLEIEEHSWLLYAWQVVPPDASAELGAIRAVAATIVAIRVMRTLGCLISPRVLWIPTC